MWIVSVSKKELQYKNSDLKQKNIYKNSKTQKPKNPYFLTCAKTQKTESLYLSSLKKPRNRSVLKNEETKKSKSLETVKNITKTALRLLPCLTLF
jgi:hypothetical protein